MANLGWTSILPTALRVDPDEGQHAIAASAIGGPDVSVCADRSVTAAIAEL